MDCLSWRLINFEEAYRNFKALELDYHVFDKWEVWKTESMSSLWGPFYSFGNKYAILEFNLSAYRNVDISYPRCCEIPSCVNIFPSLKSRCFPIVEVDSLTEKKKHVLRVQTQAAHLRKRKNGNDLSHHVHPVIMFHLFLWFTPLRIPHKFACPVTF